MITLIEHSCGPLVGDDVVDDQTPMAAVVARPAALSIRGKAIIDESDNANAKRSFTRCLLGGNIREAEIKSNFFRRGDTFVAILEKTFKNSRVPYADSRRRAFFLGHFGQTMFGAIAKYAEDCIV